MQFIKTNEFRIHSQKQIKSTLMNPKQQKRSEKTKIICCKFCLETQTLTCGLSDGSILQFGPKKFNKKKLTQNRQFQTRRFQFPAMHKGEITCLLNQKIFGQQFVITGSADRTIKIWDCDPKSKDIVQTLPGHAGTIVCMIYSRKTDTIFTGSTDKTLKIWKQDEGRKLFMYPWYVCYQTISEWTNKKLQSPVYPTALDVHDGQVNNFVLYVGDSSGSLHIIKQIQIQSQNFESQQSAFEIDRSNYNYHRLHINCLLYIPQEHLIITCGYDQQLYAFQSLSDKLLLKYSNPHKSLFTSIQWIQGMIIAADETGSMYCLRVNSDKLPEEIKKYSTKISMLEGVGIGKNDLFVVGDWGVDSVKIVKGIKAVQGQNSHKGPIVGIMSLQAYKLTQKKIKDNPKLITVSLDNTMRVWDPSDLSCLQVLPSPEKSQISSLFYLHRANLYVTGHDCGSVRLWNIELQTSITISQQQSPHAHTNNVCAFSQYVYVRSNEDVAEFMYSTGYEGKVCVWEIFMKKSTVGGALMSSTICPQLKFSFVPDQTQQNTDQIGYELYALQIWQPAGQSSQVCILSAGSKGTVHFTRIFSYQTFLSLQLHNDTITCMLIDANILFTGGSEGVIRLTNLENKEKLMELEGHEGGVLGIMMLECGYLMSRAGQGEIFFWDYPQKKIAKKLREKKDKLTCLAVVDELQTLYAGTEECKILTYSLKQLFQSPIHTGLESIAVQSMSEDQLKRVLLQNEAQLQKILRGQT